MIEPLIVETANELGMNPADLATIISYETAGTFDPTKSGPTTQWGQHRGLIQFGEPQAQQYGVDFSSPEAALMSQLGADGAIVKYYRANGWEPGMGLLDAYSIVNAGGPGLYNRSDANNGGAPGTVADKVRDQMHGHRKKAEALLNGEYTPSPIGAGAGGHIGGPTPDVGGTVIFDQPPPTLAPEQESPYATMAQTLAGLSAPTHTAPALVQRGPGYSNNSNLLSDALAAQQRLRASRKGLLG